MSNLIDSITLQQQADILAKYLRGDRLHSAKNVVATNEEGLRIPFQIPAQIGTPLDNNDNSNLRKLINGLATVFKSFKDTVNVVYDQFNPLTTTDLLDRWEKALGLPDTIFTNNSDNDIRRTQIAIRLASLNAATKAQFEAIGTAAGVDVTVTPKTSGGGAKFTLVVEIAGIGNSGALPLTLPFTLGDNIPNQLEDLFDELAPAHCEIEITYV